ncbi:hypothetical protein [Streptomyces sp. DH37]|jgi:hypothetical protein|uniref:hypothetical protein n=1 Tax=Streptomyces sp. DH37 TaxID=3040122 RepID=UPI002441779B|nr:hypothetical protein [Streptomyces sp. DH37]MDG9705983.1 hypothetical protein [Streptomyces sp. DH37]
MSTEQTGQTKEGACLVEVELPHCTASNASAVFAVLRSAFPESPELGNGQGGPGEDGGQRKFWVGTVDVRTHGEVRCTLRLEEPVEAGLSGGPDAVRQVQDALAGFYDVTAEPRISGDQEVEVRLRLTQR